MKARIIKTGRIIEGKAADVFVKCGVAEYLEVKEGETETTDEPFESKPKVQSKAKPKKRGRKKK